MISYCLQILVQPAINLLSRQLELPVNGFLFHPSRVYSPHSNQSDLQIKSDCIIFSAPTLQ